MAKFRTNHQRTSQSGGLRLIIVVILMVLILLVIMKFTLNLF